MTDSGVEPRHGQAPSGHVAGARATLLPSAVPPGPVGAVPTGAPGRKHRSSVLGPSSATPPRRFQREAERRPVSPLAPSGHSATVTLIERGVLMWTDLLRVACALEPVRTSRLCVVGDEGTALCPSPCRSLGSQSRGRNQRPPVPAAGELSRGPECQLPSYCCCSCCIPMSPEWSWKCPRRGTVAEEGRKGHCPEKQPGGTVQEETAALTQNENDGLLGWAHPRRPPRPKSGK